MFMSEIIGSLLENSEVATESTSHIGEFGEKVAEDYLRRRGYIIVATNFRVPIGRSRKGVQVTGEVDLIALDASILCFIEVKTRSSEKFTSALSAVDLRKQRQIIRTARIYRKTFGVQKVSFRYDAISVVLQGKKAPTIKHAKNYWTENKFKKKFWLDEFQH